MNFNKLAVSIPDQVAKLKERGLQINDEQKAESYLSNISYYRLRAYTYPFQDNTDPNHPFNSQISFEEIISLYVFDRQFKLLVLNALEKIEISMRTQIIYNWSMSHGSHWHLNGNLFYNSVEFAKGYTRLQQEVDRSVETFISHYKSKYTAPSEPPCWMSLEVSSFGLLSLMFKNLKRGDEKKAVVKYYGLNNVEVLQSWMHSFSNIRNVCAHHGRLWNRRLTAHIKLPTYCTNSFIQNKNIRLYKVYAALCCMKYALDIISPGHSFTQKLIKLMETCPLAQEKEMGFPNNWKQEKFWE
ncbi:MAG TPA: Abi family protein [Arachidicoccus sp.]|nr:Abi family protein [Arachidicoccus sp.]